MPTDLSVKASLSFVESAGTGMPIVFLHGSGFSKEVFSQQFESEELAGRRLIALDLPGHGASPDADDPKATYSYQGLAAAVIAFLREIELQRCIVVGWSLGGHVAYEMLDSLPEVAGVLTCGAPPAAGGPLGIIRSLHISRNLLLMSKGKFSLSDAEHFERVCLGGLRRGEFVGELMRTDEKMRPLLSRQVIGSSGGGQRERLEVSKKPLCILQGLHDPITRTGYVKTLSWPALFEGRAVIFEESGHAPFIDAEERFNRFLQRFCNAVESGQSDDTDNKSVLQSLAG